MGIRHHLIAGGVCFLGEGFLSHRSGIAGLKFPGQGHLQLGGHPAADGSGDLQRPQRPVVVVHTGQLGGHGTVNASVQRGHHVADDIGFLHGGSSSLSNCFVPDHFK